MDSYMIYLGKQYLPEGERGVEMVSGKAHGECFEASFEHDVLYKRLYSAHCSLTDVPNSCRRFYTFILN